VRFLVEEPALELADEAPALVPVRRATLLLIEIVQGSIDVAAVVDGTDVGGLEFEQREIGIDDVATVEVGGDLEVARADVRVDGAELERLELDVEADRMDGIKALLTNAPSRNSPSGVVVTHQAPGSCRQPRYSDRFDDWRYWHRIGPFGCRPRPSTMPRVRPLCPVRVASCQDARCCLSLRNSTRYAVVT